MSMKCVAPVVLVVVCITSAAQQKSPEANVKLVIHLSAEHAPEAIQANTRADLVYVVSSTRLKKGKTLYDTRPVARGIEVVSVKREKGPTDITRAVAVEVRVTKEQAAKIDQFRTRLVTAVEREGGKPVTKKRPVPLRLEPARPAKK